jgi:hypothetical protein
VITGRARLVQVPKPLAPSPYWSAQPSALPWGGREGRRSPRQGDLGEPGRRPQDGESPLVAALHWFQPRNRLVTEFDALPYHGYGYVPVPCACGWEPDDA